MTAAMELAAEMAFREESPHRRKKPRFAAFRQPIETFLVQRKYFHRRLPGGSSRAGCRISELNHICRYGLT
jgi:hypothetical protein